MAKTTKIEVLKATGRVRYSKEQQIEFVKFYLTHKHEGSIADCAQRLGISQGSLYNYIQEHGKKLTSTSLVPTQSAKYVESTAVATQTAPQTTHTEDLVTELQERNQSLTDQLCAATTELYEARAYIGKMVVARELSGAA